jgi:hypothetical protein
MRLGRLGRSVNGGRKRRKGVTVANPNPENVDMGFEAERFEITHDTDQLHLALLARFPLTCPHHLLWMGGFEEELRELCSTVGGMNDVHQPTVWGEKLCGGKGR